MGGVRPEETRPNHNSQLLIYPQEVIGASPGNRHLTDPEEETLRCIFTIYRKRGRALVARDKGKFQRHPLCSRSEQICVFALRLGPDASLPARPAPPARPSQFARRRRPCAPRRAPSLCTLARPTWAHAPTRESRTLVSLWPFWAEKRLQAQLPLITVAEALTTWTGAPPSSTLLFTCSFAHLSHTRTEHAIRSTSGRDELRARSAAVVGVEDRPTTFPPRVRRRSPDVQLSQGSAEHTRHQTLRARYIGHRDHCYPYYDRLYIAHGSHSGRDKIRGMF